MRDSYLLFIFQLIAHLSIIPLIIYGSWYHWILVLFVYFITGCFGMTMTYHRLLSHQSWKSPKWFYYFGTFAGTYGLVGSPIAWVAIHREHHAKTDTEHDPHSPQHRNFFKVQWLSMFDKPNPKYSSHLLRDNFQLLIHKNYFFIHAAIATILILIDPLLFLSLHTVPAALLWNMGSLVNTLNHRYGYKNYDSQDSSGNILLLGYLMFGEGWHNNHHAKPKNHSFKKMWWEFDLGAFFINLLDINKLEIKG